MSPKPFLLLDRDGTIIEEKHYLRDPGLVVLLPGAKDAISRAFDMGWGVAILTNQSGVARGMMSLADVDAVHERLLELLEEPRLTKDHIFICPHGPDECDCRKPLPGLVTQAMGRFEIDLPRSIVVGDRLRDLMMGRSVGAKTVLVRTGYGAREEGEAGAETDLVVDDLSGILPLIG